jgi:hypothetical protein
LIEKDALMKPERWQQIDQILGTALERDRNEWAAFLDQECAGDEELRREVESLLRAHEQAGSFIEKPPPEAALDYSGLADFYGRLTAIGQSPPFASRRHHYPRESIKSPIGVPVSPSSTVECYPCR